MARKAETNPSPVIAERPAAPQVVVVDWSDTAESSQARTGPGALRVWLGEDGWRWSVSDAETGQALLAGGAAGRDAAKVAAVAAAWHALGLIW